MHAGEQKRSPILSSSVTNPLPARMVAGSKRGELYKNQPDAEGLTRRSPRRSEIPFALRQKTHFLFTRSRGPGLRDTGFTRAERMIPVLGGGAGGETLPHSAPTSGTISVIGREKIAVLPAE